MSNKIISIAIIFVLAGCASGPVLKAPIISINKDDLSNYWTTEKHAHEKYSVEFQNTRSECKTLVNTASIAEQSHISYTYIIDSTGKTYERRYHTPSDNSDINLETLNNGAELMKFIDDTTYQPSENNKELTPVRVTIKRFIRNC